MPARTAHSSRTPPRPLARTEREDWETGLGGTATVTTMQRPLFTSIPLIAALACVFMAGLLALLLASAPLASAQALPPCGSAQMEVHLENLPRLVYAGHRYRADLYFDDGAAPPYTMVNARVTGPAGMVREVPDEQAVELAPQAAGTLALTVSWHQEDSLDRPVCSASKTLDIQVLAPLPLTIQPNRHGRSAQFAGFRRNGFGISLTLTPGEVPRFHGYREVVDLTPVRVEARAVAGARLPGRAVEPAVLEYVPGARRPRRAQRGLVKIVRREMNPTEEDGLETVRIFVAARRGLVRRGVSVTMTQGTRLIGSFAAAGRCNSSSNLGGLITGTCDFKGRHAWLWAPCRKSQVV